MSAPLPASPAGPLTDAAAPRYDSAGLVPVVVQDARDSRVLMLAWANAEAVAATLATGDVHFYSRSRSALWRKGETSGNTLRLVDLGIDCDGDALLARVLPAGPTCHRGERSCFDPDGTVADAPSAPNEEPGPAQGGALSAAVPPGAQGFGWLEVLWETIAERAASRPAGSYTARLIAEGVDGPARKVVEEATEVLMAAKDDAAAEASAGDRAAARAALVDEAADLLYHVLVLLAERGVEPAAVLERLRARHRA